MFKLFIIGYIVNKEMIQMLELKLILLVFIIEYSFIIGLIAYQAKKFHIKIFKKS